MQLLFFAGTLLSTAQSYPSLTASNPPGGASVGISTAAGAGPCLSQALTMSLTSTSSDSEQVSLEVSLTNLFSFFSLLILSSCFFAVGCNETFYCFFAVGFNETAFTRTFWRAAVLQHSLLSWKMMMKCLNLMKMKMTTMIMKMMTMKRFWYVTAFLNCIPLLSA